MNLTIKSKLILGFSLVLTLLILISFFMVSKFSETNQRLSNIVDLSAKKVSLSYEIMTALQEASRNEKNIIIESDPIEKENFKGKINSALQIVDKKTNELQDLVDEKGKLILSEFSVILTKYKANLKQIISAALKNQSEKAFAISLNTGLEIRDKAIEKIENIIEKNEKSLQNDKQENDKSYTASLYLIISIVILCFVLTILISLWIIQSITKRIATITREAEKIASREFANEKLIDSSKDELNSIFNALISINDSFKEVSENADSVASGNYSVDLIPRSEKDTLGNALKKMTQSLRETTMANEKHNWLAAGKNQLNEKLMGNQSLEELSSQTISFLCSYLKAEIGAIYLHDSRENAYLLSGQYAFLSPGTIKEKFFINEGLIGQAAHDQKLISIKDLSPENINITSSVLNTQPKHLLIIPLIFEGASLGVIEVGRLIEFNETEFELIDNLVESISININSAIARKKIQELLEETQVQSEELQAQQEELKQMNEELEEQTQNLKQQQEELQQTNEELEEQTLSLEQKNKEVEFAKTDIEQKTKQLELSSKYKSEFLANMSHELRTPLNSLLILSKDLSENKTKNLHPDQVESAEIIYKSGTDLLVLINEVLDLSKIEAGKMSINVEKFSLKNSIDALLKEFRGLAEEKGLVLSATINNDVPEFIKTDSQRLNQILKNFLSNAIKFTHKGKVSIHINKHSLHRLIINVSDSGIGIPLEKQNTVFEAFQQADGSTSRKYGGTGLGLSISKELARLLDAEIRLTSKLNEGSTFSLIIPIELQTVNDIPPKATLEQETVINKSLDENDSQFLNYPTVEDDRKIIEPHDKTVLIIEDDLKFSSIIMKQAKEKGFKCLCASTGEDGLKLAYKYHPNAIILDLDLPGINGSTVLNELKANPNVRHIPVHIISVNERSLNYIKSGAREFLTKPISKKDLDIAFNRIEDFINKKMKNLLIIEDNENARRAMCKLIGNGDVKCFEAETGNEAIALYKQNTFDCIILDIGLPDMSGFELIYKLEEMKKIQMPPIIVYTGKELTKEENNELLKYSESIIIKGVKSEERLLDETALFLHRAINKLPKSSQEIISNLYDKETVFNSKKILVVDDDMRNVFALSKVLKERGMSVLKAENGKNALDILNDNPDINLVLMDIMMPEMDGYEAMKQIRLQDRYKNLPIIALTAKAMKEDKQKCIDAGANDYIAKPLDIEKLLTLMRVWLSK